MNGIWTYVTVFRVATLCSDIVGYQHFGEPCCFHLQGGVREAWIEIQVMVFWVMTPCRDEVEYQRFEGPCSTILMVN